MSATKQFLWNQTLSLQSLMIPSIESRTSPIKEILTIQSKPLNVINSCQTKSDRMILKELTNFTYYLGR
jgi:hypothetical protein